MKKLIIAVLLAMGVAGVAQSEVQSFKSFRNTDSWGRDIVGYENVRSLNACGQMCADHSDCLVFTYNAPAEACFLKDGLGDLRRHKGALTGVLIDISPSGPRKM